MQWRLQKKEIIMSRCHPVTVFVVFFVTVLLIKDSVIAKDEPAVELPAIVIVTTGGTIAEKADPKTGGAVPAVSGAELIDVIPELKKIAKIEVQTFSNIDSSQMSPKIWAKLSKRVDKILKNPNIKGVVVTHGTDTMSEGAYFLSLTLKSKKPVVFVGAMRDASDLSPDGAANLINSVIQISSPIAQKWGVTVTMDQFVNSALYVRKVNTTNVLSFDCGEKGYLGYIVENKVIKYNDTPNSFKLNIPKVLPKVTLITTFAGDDGALIRYAADHGSLGIVVECLGAGNVNESTFKSIKYAIEKKVAVVITSRVEHGGVFPIYADQGGGLTLQKAGAILSESLKGDKARLLLMLLLPVVKDNHNELNKYFN